MNLRTTFRTVRPVLCLLFLMAISTTLVADNWSNWRGPHGNGVAEGSGYPLKWDTQTNIKWKAELPGVGGSTPAVWGDHIFVTCPSNASESAKNLVICFDRQGHERWKKELGDGRTGKHKKGSGSNPSPVTDGKHVYCYYKSGDFVCLNFAGDIVWQVNVQKKFTEDTLWWDLGTSPVLTDNAVVVACVQSGPSYVAAFDKATGDVLWKQDRMLDAPEESNQTYSTPIVYGSGQDQKLIILGADHVTCHDANNGKEVWRVGSLNTIGEKYYRSIASPVLVGDMVAAPYARGGTMTGIKLGGSGNVTDSHVKWTNKNPSSDVPTAASHDGKLFVLTDKGTVAAVNAETGETIWTGNVPKNRNAYSASPVLADGKIFITREDGTTFVLASDKFEVLATNSLDDDQVVATPVFVDGQIFMRTATHLFCIAD